ncbi:hypothetical protein GCK72_012596 [Caenorhabditis remanei]|uniref:Actin n=1 Tax=Caenorhabditis remanei TaxID=31234 RepID=A0A6A5GNG0_CAERE|nr:hypothetical protein GCK72_012596 [Caenorhabditis remanei]KAF1756143.1 hypothetical protein GCK72_012596 [Caenorhabditis remanei]
MVSESITKCDGSIREELWKNIILSGGTTCLPGFENRLNDELKVIAPNDQKVGITKSRDINSAWMGGSILALSHGFDYSWVFKEEYHEVGPSIVHRKCF